MTLLSHARRRLAMLKKRPRHPPISGLVRNELPQFHGVCVEEADALGRFLGGHGVFIELRAGRTTSCAPLARYRTTPCKE